MEKTRNNLDTRKKTITFLFMYFYPETLTIRYVFEPIINSYIEKGYHINIITPNPLRDITRDEIAKYNHSHYEKFNEHIDVYRVKCFSYKKYSKFKLALRYWSVSRRCTRKLKKITTDEVFLQTSPPIFYAYWGSKIGKKKGAKVIYNVQDLFPDNMFKPSDFMYKILNRYQKKALENSDEIITISKDMKRTLENKGDFGNKIRIIPNGPTYKISEYDVGKLDEIRKRYNMGSDTYNVVYAGNIGYLQDVDLMINASKLIDEPNIKFIIIGSGSNRKRIINRIKDENLTNVHYFPPASMEESPYIYKLADANVISLLPGVIKGACPLKTAMIIQAGQQIIAAVDEDSHYAKDLKQDYGAVIIPKQNAKLFAHEVKKLAEKKFEKYRQV